MFPTTPILDNFNRADEGPPPSANWTDIGNGLEVISNQAAGSAVGDNISYWNPITFGPDSEVYVTIPVTDVVNGVIYLRFNTGSFNGYGLIFGASTSSLSVIRLDGGVPTPLGAAISQAISNGDSVGLRVIGSTIKVYYKAAAGSWTFLDSRTDATYSAAGALLLVVVDTTMRLDNFGGGTYEGHGLLLGQQRNRSIY